MRAPDRLFDIKMSAGERVYHFHFLTHVFLNARAPAGTYNLDICTCTGPESPISASHCDFLAISGNPENNCRHLRTGTRWENASAVFHVRILYVFDSNTYEYRVLIFVRIFVRIFAYVSVRIHVHIYVRIFVRIVTYHHSYLNVSLFISARIFVHICTYGYSYLNVSPFISACTDVRI
jgi:hypothetical protein